MAFKMVSIKPGVAIHPKSTKEISEHDNRKVGKPVDNYGFIMNHAIDDNKTPSRDGDKKILKLFGAREESLEKKTARRQLKWNDMLTEWDKFKSKRFKKLQSRVRKGIPNSKRAEAWLTLSDVAEKRKNSMGLYQALLLKSSSHTEETYRESDIGEHGAEASTNERERVDSYVFEVIERDLSRTFPLHYMFCRSDSDVSTRSLHRVEAPQELDTVAKNEIISTHLSHEENLKLLESQSTATDDIQPTHASIHKAMDDSDVNDSSKRAKMFMEATGGKASLRRVLRAYSVYDREVGYCQGMNFIAAMFLTYVSEEDAFWMMVYVMNDRPCQMRGLFGENMAETHCILFVAEKLFNKFLPRLSSHFHKENVHITMFATQWLLTLYSSSFPFELVTRVWDIFLLEGWKIVYRVMIALLEGASSKLMKYTFEDILNHIKEIPKGVDADMIIRRALKIPMKRVHLQEFTEEYLSTK